ncbi:MAG TPA: hypothetical protein ACFYD0_15130 [Candidatus Wunengus sp. YC65]|uniref:hypothetical protein n=1 Tax=Candidatus Wunengus sp. YC65 TaxID=3367701 RepID=UPI00402A5051
MEKYLSILSLAVSIGSFIAVLFAKGEKKKFLVTIVALVFFIVSSTLSYIDAQRHENHIKYVATEITEILGKNSKTFDQLYEEAYFTSVSDLNEALGSLIRNGDVGHKILEVGDDRGEKYRVRGFYQRLNK